MTYDPSRQKRKGGLPKSIIRQYGITKKAWQVFRGGRTHDPRRTSRAKSYIKPARKSYARRSYDVPAQKGWGRAKAKAKGILGKVENNLMWVGLALGILVPGEVCRSKHGTGFIWFWSHDILRETKRLFGADPTYPHSSWEYIQWKFTSPDSVWTVAFWGSLAAQIVTRLGVVGLVSKRANSAIKKLSMGTLIASIFGGLFIPAGTPQASSNSGFSGNPGNTEAGRRNVTIPTNQNLMISGAF